MSHALKQSMIDGGLWVAGGRVAAIASSFLLNLLLARSLAPGDYGVYFVVLSTTIILATVGTVGMDRVVVRFVAARKAMGGWGDVRAIVWHCLRIVLFATAMLCVAFHFLTPWFFAEVLKTPAAIAFGGLMVLWLFISSVQRQLAETFRGLNDIRGATLFGGVRNNGILSSVLSCGAILALWVSGSISLKTVLVASVLTSLLVASISASTLWRRLRAANDDPGPVRSADWGNAFLLHEGWPLWLANLITVLRAQVGGWFAAGFDNAERVALYAVADRFSLLLVAPLTIVSMLLPPVVAELHARGQLKRIERIVQAVGGLASLPCLAILAVILVAGRQVLGILFGDHYQAAYGMLIVLCVGQIANIMTGSWQAVLSMTGHRQQMLRISMVAAAVQFVFSIAGGHLAGAFGVAIGATAGVLAGNILGLLATRRHLGIWTFVSIRRSVLMEALTLLRRRVPGLTSVRAPND